MFRFVVVIVLIFAMATPTAHAHPDSPVEVSLGDNPNVTLSGMLTGGAQTKIYTVPEGQDLILTTLRMEGPKFRLQNGSSGSPENIMFGGEGIWYNSGTGFTRGNAHTRVRAGEELWLGNTEVCCTEEAYLIEGYLVEEGSPYRSAWSPWDEGLASNTLTTIFTAEGRDFMVTMFLMNHSACDIYVGGELKVHGRTRATQQNGDERGGPFWTGKGRLVVPSGSALQVYGRDRSCSYTMGGRYIGP